jgi:uncharacterized protein (DUF1697 family)
MKPCIALVRGINVGGHNLVGMAKLRDFLIAAGFAEVRTLLQSGNVVFQTSLRIDAALETLLEKEAKKELGLEADFYVRSASQWEEIIQKNPFPKEAVVDPSHLLVFFCKQALKPQQIESLRKVIIGRERVDAHGREAYLVYPDGIGTSKLTTAKLEKQLGRGTGRNWNTVLKLAALLEL